MEKTSRELNTAIENLTERMEEKHLDLTDYLKRIEAQTIKTNGRVNELEKWRWMVIGALSILTALILPILFIVIKNLSLE